MTDAPAAANDAAPASIAPSAESPWPVSVLSSKIKDYIARLGAVWVEGELTQWNVRGGAVYAKLKDLEQDATVSLQMWASTRAKLDADFKQGDRVVALVKPDWWLRGGTLTMNVLQLKHVGLGDLLERLERLRRQLIEEGLFDASRKKRLPFLPHCIGLVTGKDSDAEKDVLRNAQLRWPSVSFRVKHSAVQGERAASEVAARIRELDADPEVDVIIVARGGGDFQNLLVFSDETLVRTAAAAQTPIVSAIGHENDRPLLDEVADLRASTPTDAAKRVVPDVSEELARVQQARGRIQLRVSGFIGHEIDRLGQLRSRPVMSDPAWLVDSRAEELVRWVARGSELMDHRLERATARIGELTGHLRALSPKRTLERGYAIAQLPDGRALRSIEDAPLGSALRVTVADGAVAATVDGVEAAERAEGRG
ncbi:exodeoxyribonuclease VII large subunit [Schumannella luteola]|uniref:Exodeoxyribonuclease 7 large subunit n=1 Tax=Schumannella luteola TaxID=472059 RepID=A0A852YDQ9_9MICO|nr:exodeoxyribonuclease VII large subunit [Schumannella luteola]NYG99434.1 exodeoxyribonuclease VII large subunit [Schumannella luteola]TPX06150.1 exodeoxyribonuclease VII large subunit [Schumannella luteola]